MKIKALLQWQFVYLPPRFTVPFLTDGLVSLLREAVFASMDLPPLFAYQKMGFNIHWLNKKLGSPTENKPVKILAICPQQPLSVDTAEFWKTDEFGEAFHTMYQATRVELSRFDFATETNVMTGSKEGWLRMALVSPAGDISYNYRF